MQFMIRFRVGYIIAILMIVGAMTAATLASVWFTSTRAAEEIAAKLFNTVAGNAETRVDDLIGRTLDLTAQGAAQRNMGSIAGLEPDRGMLPFLFSSLESDPALYSLYYGYPNGDFLQLIAVRGDERIMLAHKVPPGTEWIVRTIARPTEVHLTSESNEGKSRRLQTWRFLDANRQLLDQRLEENPAYDPSERPWYKAAWNGNSTQLSKAYEFNSLKQLGLTTSRNLEGGQGVFGADITLSGLSGFLAGQSISDKGGIILYDSQNRILAMSPSLGSYQPLASLKDVDAASVRALVNLPDMAGQKGLRRVRQGETDLLVQTRFWRNNGRSIGISVIAPADDFLGHMRVMQWQIFGLAILCMGIFIPVGLLVSGRMSHSIQQLSAYAEKVRNLDFSDQPPLKTRVIEFQRLGRIFSLMRSSLAGKTLELEESQAKLTKLVDLGIAISAERDNDRLMEMILSGAKELANADGGTLYLTGKDGNLHFQIVRNDSLGLVMGGTSGSGVAMPPVPMFDSDSNPNHCNVASHAVHEQQTVNIPDAYDATGFDFSGTKEFDLQNGYQSTSFLTVPLKPRGGDVIGVLQLINARLPGSDRIVPFSKEIQHFVEALAAQAATALYNRELLDAQDRLMDSMIQLIAGAIDAKSPYTGGHCERVPELAVMLAREASLADGGPLADFRFSSKEEWREFKIGAWLHDCGKVITPEFVVDKATKLETIYNRIHEIRARFEILLRDARIEQLEQIAAGISPETAEQAFEEQKKRLADDFAFIADCNIGGEFMAPEKIERLQSIAEQTWMRHFDNRMGLSGNELERHAGPARPLPAEEKLLDDRPAHIIPRETGLHHGYEGLGFKIDVPENLYDRGELHNLSIARGTLTDEERFKINEHIMQTIAMLERMPFPNHLQRVPEYAGTHHETLIGTGYPRRLDRDSLSVPSRIMAIADIFEALTASDRPYKKAKSLSESVKILSFFRNDGHIDPDLFELFLRSGVYQQYAEKFLQPDQIDEVDVSRYLQTG